jgi:hypothetical protein
LERSARGLIEASGAAVDAASVTYTDCELLLYEVGGKFKAHVDRCRGRNHVGTLLVIVPSEDLRGGALRTGPRGVEGGPDPRQPTAVFLPLGVEHSVSKVTRGWRLVAKAAVFGARTLP